MSLAWVSRESQVLGEGGDSQGVRSVQTRKTGIFFLQMEVSLDESINE